MRLLIFLCLVSTSSACDDSFGLCDNSIVQTAKSPDGARVAILFKRDCGATTATSTQISVLTSTQPLKGGGNAFVADDNHGAVGTNTTGALPVGLRWLSADQLSISFPAAARVFKKEARVSGVSISYVP